MIIFQGTGDLHASVPDVVSLWLDHFHSINIKMLARSPTTLIFVHRPKLRSMEYCPSSMFRFRQDFGDAFGLTLSTGQVSM